MSGALHARWAAGAEQCLLFRDILLLSCTSFRYSTQNNMHLQGCRCSAAACCALQCKSLLCNDCTSASWSFGIPKAPEVLSWVYQPCAAPGYQDQTHIAPIMCLRALSASQMRPFKASPIARHEERLMIRQRILRASSQHHPQGPQAPRLLNNPLFKLHDTTSCYCYTPFLFCATLLFAKQAARKICIQILEMTTACLQAVQATGWA